MGNFSTRRGREFLATTVFTRNDLRKAVVGTLEGRPNHSCKKNVLPNLVCTYLGVSLTGNIRKKLKHEINLIVAALKRANIIEEYRAKNIRCRLAPSFSEGLARLLNRGSGEEVCFDSSNPDEKIRKPNLPQDLSDEEVTVEATYLPPLSDTIESPLFDLDEDEGDEGDYYLDTTTDDEPPGSEADILEIMSGTDLPETEVDDEDSEQSNNRTVDPYNKIAAIVKTYTSSHPSLQYEPQFNHVRLALTVSGVEIFVKVSFSRRLRTIHFRVLFPDVSITPEEILLQTANDQFTCIPGLKKDITGTTLQLRRDVMLTSELEQLVPDTLDEVINDAVDMVHLAEGE
jgi:hypothetical protein